MPFALRVAISVALLAFIAYQVDWGKTYYLLAASEWRWLLIAFVAFNASMVLAARRWQVLLDTTANSTVPFRAAIKGTYSSLWLSNFLPTAFGGDIARVATARSVGADVARAAAVSVVDRYLGFVTLSLIFLCSESVAAWLGHEAGFRSVATFLALGFLGSLVFLVGGAQMRMPRRWLRKARMRQVARCTGVLRALGRRGGWNVSFLLLNVIVCACGVGAYWAAANCLSHQVSLQAAIAAATLGALASSLPISPSGWGVREGTVAVVLSQAAGISAGEAGLIALLNGLVIGGTSLLGVAASTRLNWRRQGPIAPSKIAG